ncbi:hypothetical protein CC78DRAFT_566609 [Lojkania enalia]|uniref:Uncharacterized protein n=1 Tax=Lojkania enalia TaxID=147567 RepID=A0A9P4KDW8_9PLEO|nr:hypothetical protein CC78DRAFT_566609 [Didymosphaeria enalia]
MSTATPGGRRRPDDKQTWRWIELLDRTFSQARDDEHDEDEGAVCPFFSWSRAGSPVGLSSSCIAPASRGPSQEPLVLGGQARQGGRLSRLLREGLVALEQADVPEACLRSAAVCTLPSNTTGPVQNYTSGRERTFEELVSIAAVAVVVVEISADPRQRRRYASP